MSKPRYRYQMYKRLHENISKIYEEARKVPQAVGMPESLKGNVGLTGAVSSCHALLRKDITEAMDAASRKVIENKFLADEIRGIVKDVYGDEWDGVPVNTCEAALWVTFDSLFTPPFQGRGDNYRARYIAPYEKHLHHQGGYGRPFPPKYKDLIADRGVTAGELGFYGKRQNNLDTVIVPLKGARYDCHGIKFHPAPMLTQVDPEASIAVIEEVAERHRHLLTGFTSLSYDTPGYGYGAKDPDGTPRLQRLMGELAKKYNVPYLGDNAWGVPFVGTDPRKVHADVMVYSMDKASGAPTVGLIIGKEDVMVTIRRALGTHGERSGVPLSYGKAAYVTNDAGKEGIVGLIAALKVLRDRPEVVTKPIDDLYEIVVEEFAKLDLPKDLKDGWLITKSYNSSSVEVNYEGTWKDGKLGVPIFTIEDMYAGTGLLQSGMAQMGIVPTLSYDGNIFISPGLGTTDEEGKIIEDVTRYVIRALVKLIEIVCKYSGLLD